MEVLQNRKFAFEDLLVWQKAVDFAENVIKLIDIWDAPRKHYRLIEQLEASATSIAMNIAEGKGRYSQKEFLRFLYIARGSIFETVTLMIIMNRMDWISKESINAIKKQAEEIIKMLNSLIKSLKMK